MLLVAAGQEPFEVVRVLLTSKLITWGFAGTFCTFHCTSTQKFSTPHPLAASETVVTVTLGPATGGFPAAAADCWVPRMVSAA
jgi:hypothetical protein